MKIISMPIRKKSKSRQQSGNGTIKINVQSKNRGGENLINNQVLILRKHIISRMGKVRIEGQGIDAIKFKVPT